MRIFGNVITGLIALILITGCRQPATNNYNVTEYGAVGDSSTMNTEAIQKAIDAATKAGGGEVVVPPGVYLSGTIFLKDNVTLLVRQGAKILGSPNLEDYYKHKWGHNIDRQPYHLILGLDAQNIEVRGGGVIDGNGQAFWQDFHQDSLPQWILPKKRKISPMMEIEGCTDVRIKDVTLKTGGGWTLHLYNSKDVQVQGIQIPNNIYSPNGDGIDITGSENITISDCIISTTDDGICMKTTVDSKECKRITVNNCVIETLCAALKIGNESFRDISRITFSNCVVYGSSRAFAVYAESAGTVSDIQVNNIVCDTKAPLIYNRPIHLSLYLPEPGHGGRTGDWMFKEKERWDYKGREPQMKNITITNFTTTTGGRILCTAEDGRHIENLTLRNIKMNYPWIENPNLYVDRMKSSQFNPVTRSAKTANAAMVMENIKNLVVDHFVINWPESDTVPDEWKFPKRIGNGTLDPFYPDYDEYATGKLSAFYGRGLKNGYIKAPFVKASQPDLSTFDVKGSSIEIND